MVTQTSVLMSMVFPRTLQRVFIFVYAIWALIVDAEDVKVVAIFKDDSQVEGVVNILKEDIDLSKKNREPCLQTLNSFQNGVDPWEKALYSYRSGLDEAR